MSLAQKKADNIYRTNGAAAYDVRKSAERKKSSLPEDRKPAERVRRVKATMRISPFTVIGLLVTAFMAVLVVFGYVGLYEASAEITAAENRIEDLQDEQAKLKSVYEDKFDLPAVEQQATELGMIYPKTSQVVYVNLDGTDRAEITPAQSSNPIAVVYYAIRDSVKGFVEYLS